MSRLWLRSNQQSPEGYPSRQREENGTDQIPRAIPTRSCNNINECTTFLSTVHETFETLGKASFTVGEFMLLLEMAYFQQSNSKVHKKIYTSMEESLDEAGDNTLQ